VAHIFLFSSSSCGVNAFLPHLMRLNNLKWNAVAKIPNLFLLLSNELNRNDKHE
jgi:hypothetical protein